MEKLKYKYEKFVRALEALGRAISSFSRHDIPEDLKEHILTSIIKHYEMCYESGWKFLKLYLEKEYEIKLDFQINNEIINLFKSSIEAELGYNLSMFPLCLIHLLKFNI